jgi:hypothetical protein
MINKVKSRKAEEFMSFGIIQEGSTNNPNPP